LLVQQFNIHPAAAAAAAPGAEAVAGDSAPAAPLLGSNAGALLKTGVLMEGR
jgi:hypothetical protein